MKPNIHPKYEACRVLCACGNVIETRSTQSEIRVEVCSNCHSFFTGKASQLKTAGRVEKFSKRFAKGRASAQASS